MRAPGHGGAACRRMRPSAFHIIPIAFALSLASCVTTSLSDPNGRGHGSDLDLHSLTGIDDRNTGEAAIAAATDRRGTLPARGARILLVQSGAYQPDAELVAAFRPFCDPVLWDGQRAETENDAPDRGAGRRLRLAAARQGCSHVVVVLGEIQSDSRALPTAALTWVPIAGDIIPGQISGTRLVARALVMETRADRWQLLDAAPRETRGLQSEYGRGTVNGRRAARLKAQAYPELAARCFP